jgi:predicted DNA-binding transcriptional regulator AlpA
MSKSDKIRHTKKSLINALEKAMGVVTTACKNVGIHRSTFYEYYNNDPEFKKEVNDIGNVALDFTESKMFEQIRDGNTTLIKFYLATKGKKRGYVERQEITGSDGEKLFEIKIIDTDNLDEDRGNTNE